MRKKSFKKFIGRIKEYLFLFVPVPFLLAIIGYCFIGQLQPDGFRLRLPILEGLYASAALYFVNPVSDIENGFVLAAKIFALFVAATIIFKVLGALFGGLVHSILGRCFKKSTVVFGDNEWAEQFVENLPYGYRGRLDDGWKNKLDNPFHASHIVFMDRDEIQNLKMYTKYCENKKEFESEQKEIYIMVSELDSSLFTENKPKHLHFFSVYQLIARQFWKQYSIMGMVKEKIGTEGAKHKIRIGIDGYKSMGRELLKQAYLTNLFSKKQEIVYTVWSLETDEHIENLPMGITGDKLRFSSALHEEKIREMLKQDIVILTGPDRLDTLQELKRRNFKNKIYYYATERTLLDKLVGVDSFRLFGDLDTILTWDIVMEESTLKLAKLLNYDYKLKTDSANSKERPEVLLSLAEQKWEGLSGFHKLSSIARADYYQTERKLLENGMEEEEAKELEHIRWCRFMYYHYWTYGKKRDDENRKHTLLVSYQDLREKEKQKDDTLHPAIEALIQKGIV